MTIVNSLVSIIIPNFNSEKFVADTLDSVINQTYKNWEAIVVDDGSTDGSWDIISQYSNNHSNIHSILRYRDPKGGNTCRNIGLNAAKGEFVIFLDSDDILAEWCLRERVSCMLENPHIDFGIFKMGCFYQKLNEIKIKSDLNVKEPLRHFIALDNIWQTTSSIWKTDFIILIGGFNEKYSRLQDVELNFRALTFEKVHFKLFKENIPDFYFRLETNSFDTPFWEKAYKNVELYLSDVLKWISTDTGHKKYKRYLNRTAWNYLIYWWRSESKESIKAFIYHLKEKEVFCFWEVVFIKTVLSCHNFRIMKYFLLKNSITNLLRTVKYFRRPNFNE